MYRSGGKRLLDVAAASIGLCMAVVPAVFVALAIRINMGSPVLFRHERTGFGGERFEMLKFRTMQQPVPGGPSQSAERISPLGRILRSLSIDEIPQLVNVLRGDMSIVGPRPVLPDYDPLYSADQWRRFEVRPGVTGLAQISGRSRLAWSQKFSLDVEYVDQMSLAGDLKIIAVTARKLFDRSSTVADGAIIQERFDGSN